MGVKGSLLDLCSFSIVHQRKQCPLPLASRRSRRGMESTAPDSWLRRHEKLLNVWVIVIETERSTHGPIISDLDRDCQLESFAMNKVYVPAASDARCKRSCWTCCPNWRLVASARDLLHKAKEESTARRRDQRSTVATMHNIYADRIEN